MIFKRMVLHSCIGIIFSLLFMMSACTPGTLYENTKAIKLNQWNQNEPLDFEVDVKDTAIPYNFFINVRNGGNYQFSNLFLFISTKMPDGSNFTDTLECTLSDPDGRWIGSGIGDIYDAKIPFKKNVIFPQKGLYQFRIEQAMRMNPLPYIYDVGIAIERSDTKKKKRFFIRLDGKKTVI